MLHQVSSKIAKALGQKRSARMDHQSGLVGLAVGLVVGLRMRRLAGRKMGTIAAMVASDWKR